MPNGAAVNLFPGFPRRSLDCDLAGNVGNDPHSAPLCESRRMHAQCVNCTLGCASDSSRGRRATIVNLGLPAFTTVAAPAAITARA
jgi:hypothetical protein